MFDNRSWGYFGGFTMSISSSSGAVFLTLAFLAVFDDFPPGPVFEDLLLFFRGGSPSGSAFLAGDGTGTGRTACAGATPPGKRCRLGSVARAAATSAAFLSNGDSGSGA